MFSIWVKREPSLVAAASNSSFYIIFALGPGFITKISRCVSTAIQEFSFEDSIGEPFELSNYAASASCCSFNFSANCTTFAVWMPKKMYNTSYPTQGVMLLLPIFFTSTPNSRLCILMQWVSVTPQPNHPRQRILYVFAHMTSSTSRTRGSLSSTPLGNRLIFETTRIQPALPSPPAAS